MPKLFILDVYNFINAQRFEDGCVPEEKINTEELLEDIKSVIITQESIISSRDKCIEKEIRKNNELQKCIAEYNTTMPSQSALYREVLKQELKRSHELNVAQPLVKRIEKLKQENEELKQGIKDLFLKFD